MVVAGCRPDLCRDVCHWPALCCPVSTPADQCADFYGLWLRSACADAVLCQYAHPPAAIGADPPWLAPLAFTGRMPLTNYLLQSVVCTLIFLWLRSGVLHEVWPSLRSRTELRDFLVADPLEPLVVPVVSVWSCGVAVASTDLRKGLDPAIARGMLMSCSITCGRCRWMTTRASAALAALEDLAVRGRDGPSNAVTRRLFVINDQNLAKWPLRKTKPPRH
jgi:hypothetical protein